MKIITPLRPSNFPQLQTWVAKINNRTDLIEVWLDQIYEDENFWQNWSELKRNFAGQWLGVCKTKEQKGNFTGNETDRIEILQKFLQVGANYVDLDIGQNSSENIKKIPSEKLILSFHDFISVPSDLEKIAEQMKTFSPQIMKFALTTNTETEFETFLKFINNWPNETPAIFTTMGKLGKVGREKIGEKSWAGFWALNENLKTAEGQPVLEK